MLIFMFLLAVLALAGVVATIRGVYRDSWGSEPARLIDEYDALIRWR